jgi:mono/diheme cytochrome c family protein
MKAGWQIPRMTRNRLIGAVIGGGVVAVVGAIWLVVYAGAYNISADAPHTGPVSWLLDNVRLRSITVRAAGISVPRDLQNPKRIAAGAAEYAEMCSGCHLAPGMKKTEISQGLYPRAPELSRGVPLTPAEEFWVLKHGIKMTGMPAWGPTHDDAVLWDIVAFLRKLPALTPAQYQAIAKSAPESHEEMMQNMHMDQEGHHK